MTGTNANRDPDSVLAAWLDEGPTDLPDATRRAILMALPTTPQARRGLLAPWRSPHMNMFARGASVLVVAIVAIGALALLAGPRLGIGGPGPTASPSVAPSDPPLPTLDATFTSASYGYQIRYPTGWGVSRGRGPWPLNVNLSPGDPVTDSIVASRPVDRVRISIASIALPSGMTMEEFRAFASPYSAPFQRDPCPSLAPLPGPVALSVQGAGGSSQTVPAVVSINGCNALAELGGHVYDVEAIAAGRGYDFIIDGHISPADALKWLASITLEPASAAAVSPAPSAATSPAASR